MGGKIKRQTAAVVPVKSEAIPVQSLDYLAGLESAEPMFLQVGCTVQDEEDTAYRNQKRKGANQEDGCYLASRLFSSTTAPLALSALEEELPEQNGPPYKPFRNTIC